MRLEIVCEPSDEGGFTVYVPALPGCISEGETIDECRENIREALELWFEDLPRTVPEGSVVDLLVV